MIIIIIIQILGLSEYIIYFTIWSCILTTLWYNNPKPSQSQPRWSNIRTVPKFMQASLITDTNSSLHSSPILLLSTSHSHSLFQDIPLHRQKAARNMKRSLWSPPTTSLLLRRGSTVWQFHLHWLKTFPAQKLNDCFVDVSDILVTRWLLLLLCSCLTNLLRRSHWSVLLLFKGIMATQSKAQALTKQIKEIGIEARLFWRRRYHDSAPSPHTSEVILAAVQIRFFTSQAKGRVG